MEGFASDLLDLIKQHQDWASAIIFVTAFGESFAFLGLLLPGTTMLIAAGTLMRSGALPFLPLMGAAIVGAVLGDSVSYWIGRRFGGGVAKLWPFSRRPDMLPAGVRFFERHGGKSVFIGRFFGPVRAVIPLAAGVMQMPRSRFWAANIGSALVWAPMLLLAGDLIGVAGDRLIGSGNTAIAVFVGLTVIGVGGAVWAARHASRNKP